MDWLTLHNSVENTTVYVLSPVFCQTLVNLLTVQFLLINNQGVLVMQCLCYIVCLEDFRNDGQLSTSNPVLIT